MDIPKSLRKALGEVKTASEARTEIGKFARLLRPLLEAAVAELGANSVVRQSRRGTGEMNYIVETTQQGEVLTEERIGGTSKPFRCPKSVYDALSFELESPERPLALDEIMSALERRLSDRPADHQVRVALRLWMHVEPPLLARNRARYRPSDAAKFRSRASEIWTSLRH